ncbi:hypothetical protein tpqmel_0119 [Candidatus Gastranaerophilus sp. (ex Termes propinquus)]|nr:hypothetical protein tpqmel_0119 [Candidatus Gastranaerophilus sp. (ex Termes propinquus)]
MAVLSKLNFTKNVLDIINNSKSVTIPKSKSELVSMAFGTEDSNYFEVSYDVCGKPVTEVTVVRCKNGAVVNYTEDYMRRRDPDCLVISDDKLTDKPRYEDVYKKDFSELKCETFNWLKEQELIVMPFMAGGKDGYEAVLIAPKNAAFFACGLAALQHFVNIDEWQGEFAPKAVIYLAPPFRHTHFDGKQIVVHSRSDEVYEMFSYNLYPGPSAKKGVYGFLLDIGEREGWVVAHASAVKVITPYENEIVIMHEGASGGGKSEMGENIHREPDGKIVIGQNLNTNEKFYLTLDETCELRPIADDIVLCHPKIQNDSKKLVIEDAEDGWFLRVDNIKGYGTEIFYEKIYTQPSEPLVFMNIQGVPTATCLVWEHTLDSDGTPCPNPRVILPRKMVPNIVDDPTEVDVRSFGVRTPMATSQHPSYGILGMLHMLPPALAWLWRLTAPRGHNNPSIIDSEGMTSEGVGSYWPFATGKMVNHANLLLEQILSTPYTRYVLIPNQHIGCYKVGFMPQWIMREYLARRGSAKFKLEHLVPARSSLLGYCLESLKVDGQYIRKAFLRPETQAELGLDGYDKGAKILSNFFKKELEKFNTPELNPLGKKIIECCLSDATLDEYLDIIPMRY